MDRSAGVDARVEPLRPSGARRRSLIGRTFLVLALAGTVLAVAGSMASPASAYELLVNTSAVREGGVPLEASTMTGDMYVFVSPESGVRQVRFYLDDPERTQPALSNDRRAPWDLVPGTHPGKPPEPYDTNQLSNGQHTLTAAITKSRGGTEIVTAVFTVSNGPFPGGCIPGPCPDALLLSPFPDHSSSAPLAGATVAGSIHVFAQAVPGIIQVRFYLDDPDRAGPPIHTENSAAWDFAGTAADGTAVPYDTTSLADGQHSITAGVTRSTGTNVITSTFTIENPDPPPPPPPPPPVGKCPVPCSEVLVSLPRELDWSSDHGGMLDRNGVGTGFTWLDKPTNGTGYIPSNLDVAGGKLNVRTTSGLAYGGVNSLDNGLGVGIAAPNQRTLLKTTLANPPPGNGEYQQAGLWFGNDEKSYVKLVLMSTPSGAQIQFNLEVADVSSAEHNTSTLSVAGADVELRLIADPTDRSIAAAYRIGTGPLIPIATVTAPGELFSFDAAGIDPEIRTRSFGGIFASHRHGTFPLTYSFDDFSVSADASVPPPPTGEDGVSFSRTTIPVPMPTSMVWGPDDRLYVSELFGTIHAISFDSSGAVAGDEVITTLGDRLTLGITVDPLSTPGDVILWAAHSNASTENGEPNSGKLTRLSGPGFATSQDVITGLPRAIANHATNSIHFGPDDRLYLAQGGNTGAGAPNSSASEFGTMQEQPLSAALLVADVRSPTFDGSCHNESDIFGPPPCDVQTYSTGLRNTYDFVFHSNGSLYGPDNGLGVTGTYPPSPTPPCLGFGDPAPYTSGGHNPGDQPDYLNRLEQGKYYGHPNPHRDECVFWDGHWQGVSPLPNYVAPLHNLGDNRSANGTIEYTADAFCGVLEGDLLISNYSVGDDLTRVRLSADGHSVTSATSLVAGFVDPLPVVQNPAGQVFVGELGASRVTVLTPVDDGPTAGCWKTKAPMPSQVLDAGGAAVDGKLYVVAGKDAISHFDTVQVYDPAAGTWASAPDLPGPAVENPATIAADGKLYVFGGSTAAFSGATTNAAVFDPAASTWTSLPPLPTARGGAGAQAIDGKIYVMGGMGGDGASLDSVEVFDVATNEWTTAAPMDTRRDNPGTAALDGKLYAFGGRTRNADGSTTDGTLSSVEAYDPATNTWSAKASMPTGRRTMVVGTLNGRAQVMGGEITATNGTFPQNEEYDPVTDSWRTVKPMPTPRHGAAAGTINGVVYVAGGGPAGGTSLSNVNEAFSFGAIP